MPPNHGNGPGREAAGPDQETTISFCPVCGRKMPTLETREVMVGIYKTIWRRKRCNQHPGRFSTLELPEHLAREVMADDD